LRQSEERFRSVTQSAIYAIIVANSRGNIISWNNAAHTIFGYGEEEALGKPLTLLMPERFHDPHRRGLQRFLSTGKSDTIGKTVEFAGRKKDGTEFPLELSLASWKTGEETSFTGIIRDVTERKQVEEALRQAEEKYRGIFENATEGIYQTTPGGRFITANPALAGILGYECPEELITGVTDIERQLYVKPNDRKELIRKIEEQGAVEGFETQLYRKDGSRIWISTNVKAVRDAQGTILYLEGTNEDITERKRVEEALRKLSGAIEQTADNVLITSLDGRIEYVNPAFVQLTGYTLEEALGKTPRILKSGAQSDAFYRHMCNTILSGETFREVIVNKKTNGELYYEEKTISPLLDEHGNITHFVSVGRDISQRKRMEETLQESEMQLATAQEVANLGSWDADLLSNTVSWSDQLYHLLGMNPRECAASLEAYLAFVHTDDRERIRRTIERAQRDRQPYEFEHGIVRKDGTVRILWAKGFLRVNEFGRPIRMFGVAQDITERKQAEEERERLILELKGALANVRQLGGLLPICASCKKIRDDKGYWTQVEKYFMDHSDATFTHGVCPECMKVLYPDYYAKIKRSAEGDNGT
ncbi:MAG: PAS domain S-box protein, partial [Bacteroidota bacterium]